MTVSEGNSSESVKETSTDATGPSMKRVSRVSSSGHDNPGLELSDAVSSQVRMWILLCLCFTFVCSIQ